MTDFSSETPTSVGNFPGNFPTDVIGNPISAAAPAWRDAKSVWKLHQWGNSQGMSPLM